MIRKSVLRLVACVLALLLPLCAVAETSTMEMLRQAKADGKEIVSTVTFTPGMFISQYPLVSELSSALSLQLNKLPGGFLGATLLTNGEACLNANLRVNEQGAYLQGEAFGDQPLYVSWEDVKAAYLTLLSQSGMDEQTIAAIEESFTAGLNQGLSVGTSVADGSAELTYDAWSAAVTDAMGGDDSLVKLVDECQSKMVITQGDYEVANGDIAQTKSEMTITPEDFAKVCDFPYFREQVAASLKAEMTDATDEEIAAQVDEMIAEAKQYFIDMNLLFVVSAYSNKDDTELIGADITVTAQTTQEVEVSTPTDDEVETSTPTASDTGSAIMSGVESVNNPTDTVEMQTETVTLNHKATFHIAKKTLEDGKLYTMNAYVLTNDETQFAMNGTLTRNAGGAVGTLAFGDGSELKPVVIDLNYTKEENHRSVAVTFTVSESADSSLNFAITADEVLSDNAIDAELGFDLLGMRVGTINVDTVIGEDSGAFAALTDATPETSLQPMLMSGDELQTYSNYLMGSLTQAVSKVLLNLPTETVGTIVQSAMSANN